MKKCPVRMIKCKESLCTNKNIEYKGRVWKSKNIDKK